MIDAIFISIPRNASGSVERACSELQNFEYFNEHLGELNQGFVEQRTWHRAYEKFSESWDHAKKFTVIRNPWARTVSMYHHRTLVDPAWSFGEFIKLIPALCSGRIIQSSERVPGATRHHPDKFVIQHHVLPQILHFYTADHSCSMDYVLRLENLQEDFNRFLEALGMEPLVLEHYNFSGPDAPKGRSTTKKYVEFYTEPWMIEEVGRVYKEDVTFGDYRFGQEYEK